ncbi:hypothetical protein ACOYXF_07520 [Pseudomonas sp. Tul1A2]
MSDTPPTLPPQQTLIQNLIAELTAAPVITPGTPSRTLEIPRSCLLREWMELYWTALERPEFLDWASRFHIDLDTLRLKGDTLQAQTPSNGTTNLRTFTLEDDFGWWQMAPMLLSIAQHIDPGRLGLPYIGGKSANPLYRFPREVVLAFYGYPEPQNAIQAEMIVAELKAGGLAAIDQNGNTTSAVVKERIAQLQDLKVIAETIDEVVRTSDPFEQRSLANTPVSLNSASILATRGGPSFKLGQLLASYGWPQPVNVEEARVLAQRLRQHDWPPLPYVSEYVQTGIRIKHYQDEFADIEDCRHIVRRLEDLSWNKTPTAKIDLEELSEPIALSALGERIAIGQRDLLKLRSEPAFQAILQQHKLPADSQLLLTSTGHVGTSSEHGWVTLTSQVEKHAGLKSYRDRLRNQAREAGGALRVSGQVSLAQMLGFYQISRPKTVQQALLIAKWERTNLHMRPGYMNHWYLLGQPGKQTERLTTEQRRIIVETTRAFMPKDSAPLIDYLSEGVDTDLPLATLKAKADYLISRILITPRAQALGNVLLDKLAAPAHTKALLATNRERLLIAALILSLDATAGEHPDRIIGQPLNDNFFWGESYEEVRRFIDHQFGLTLVKNKTLATHLLLSGLAPEFLIRDIPANINYMSCVRWVSLKQIVLYIENRFPGVARLMTYGQLSALTKGQVPADFYTFLRSNACASAVLDWAVVRGLIQRKSDSSTTLYDAVSLKRADIAFRKHNRQMSQFYRRAFMATFPTPATVALNDLRKIFADNAHLEDKTLFLPASKNDCYSLIEMHLAARLSTDMQAWQSNHAQVSLTSMSASFARLRHVPTLFHAALAARLKQMKNAHIALIKEAFCRLPLAQRLDIEDNTVELLALQPLPFPAKNLAGQIKSAGDTAPFAIIALLRGTTHRVFEIFTQRSVVVLRRDIDIALLAPSAANAKAKSLPFDAQAYRNGTLPNTNATCNALITRLKVHGAPLPQQTRSDVPDTFSSKKVEAIATTAVRHLFDAYESQALQQALIAPALKDTDESQNQWLKFYAILSPPK